MRFRPLFLFLVIALLCGAGRLSAATTIPFQFRDGMIWMKVSVPGKSETLDFLLDSGAGVSVVDVAAARRVGWALGDRKTVQGVHGTAAAYRVRGVSASTGGAAIPGALLAIDLSAPSGACHQRIDGLLGADFFRDRIVQIDYAAQRVRLLQRGELDETNCEIVPLAARNDAWCARVSVNGNGAEWMRVDTGCSTALEWVVSGVKANRPGVTTLGLNAGSVRECCTEVQLGAKRLAAVKTGIHRSPMFAGEAGLIGNGLLSRFTVTIDVAKRRCLLGGR